MGEEWHRGGRLADLEEDEPIQMVIGGREIGLYLVDGRVYALDDKCPHARALLTDGFQDGSVATCPKHHAQFDVVSGRCVTGPGGTAPNLPALTTHTVRLNGDEILVRLDG